MRVKAKGHYLYVQPKPKAYYPSALVIESEKLKSEKTKGIASTGLNKGQYKYPLPEGLTAKDLINAYVKK